MPVDPHSGLSAAELEYRSAIAADPVSIEARTRLASELLGREQYPDALKLLGEALTIDHKGAATLVLVARAQSAYGNRQEARTACELVLDRHPQHVEALIILARLMLEEGEAGPAQDVLEEVLRTDPNSSEATLLIAAAKKSVGQMDDARDLLLALAGRDDAPPAAYLGLSELGTPISDGEMLARIKGKLRDGAEEPRDRAVLHYALGRFLERQGEYDRAFGHFASGAALARSAFDYAEADMLSSFDEVAEVFDSRYLSALAGRAAQEPVTPVFIVGMPRSGSTLVEQVIASHPQAFSEGESLSFEHVLASFRRENPGLPHFPQLASRLDADDVARLSAQYRAHVRQRAGNAAVLVNKLPGNLLFVGMIHAALPEARFIATRRDLKDTCLSCFTTLFAEQVEYSYNVAEVGRYARKNAELMGHWSRLLPADRSKEVRYEDFVADPDRLSRELIDFVGLPWSDQCLDFHSSVRTVWTASAVQVRQPIHQNSVGRWRHFERHLGSLLEALGEPSPGSTAFEPELRSS